MKNKTKVKNKALLELLTGENIERPNTRVEENSSISFSIHEKNIDKDGNEYIKEIPV